MNNLDKSKKAYLETYIFFGLANLNNGFDVGTIKYFSEEEFEIVLHRVKEFGWGIMGIEPWKNGEFYDVRTCEEFKKSPEDESWYRQAFEEFKSRGVTLQYSASYYLPKSLLIQEDN